MPQDQPELCLTAQLGEAAVGDTSRLAGAEGGKESPTRQFTLSIPSLSTLVPSMKACYMVAREQVVWGSVQHLGTALPQLFHLALSCKRPEILEPSLVRGLGLPGGLGGAVDGLLCLPWSLDKCGFP